MTMYVDAESVILQRRVYIVEESTHIEVQLWMGGVLYENYFKFTIK
jgi:hypothetical protein